MNKSTRNNSRLLPKRRRESPSLSNTTMSDRILILTIQPRGSLKLLRGRRGTTFDHNRRTEANPMRLRIVRRRINGTTSRILSTTLPNNLRTISRITSSQPLKILINRSSSQIIAMQKALITNAGNRNRGITNFGRRTNIRFLKSKTNFQNTILLKITVERRSLRKLTQVENRSVQIRIHGPSSNRNRSRSLIRNKNTRTTPNSESTGKAARRPDSPPPHYRASPALEAAPIHSRRAATKESTAATIADHNSNALGIQILLTKPSLNLGGRQHNLAQTLTSRSPSARSFYPLPRQVSGKLKKRESPLWRGVRKIPKLENYSAIAEHDVDQNDGSDVPEHDACAQYRSTSRA